MTRKSSTKTLIAAMRVLARDIQSDDGVANAAIAEAADRLEELHADHLRDATKMVEQQARIAELDEMKARTTEAAPFAWATFDGEGSYDLRLYECNESYRDEWLAANGRLYADWVIPLYEAPDELRGRIAELECQAAIGRRVVLELRALEWSRPVIDSNGFLGQGCIECGRGRESGHTEKCVAAAILRDTEQVESSNSRAILDSSDHFGDATNMVTDRQLADAVNELRDIAIKYHAAGQLRERIAVVVHGLVRASDGR